MTNTIYICGHKNPDTDSIVAASSYERLMHLTGNPEYKSIRAGKLNPQTEYIYKKFGVEPPEYVVDLFPRVAYYMNENFSTVNEKQSLWSAISLMQKNNDKVLPIVDDDGNYKALLHYNAFAQNVLTLMNPERQITTTTSISLITKTLNAQALKSENTDEVFKATILVGASNLDTFKEMLDAHLSENVVVVTGDRRHVQDYCIEKGIRALVITAGHLPSKELQEKAKNTGTSILVSPYDTSSTSMLLVYSTPVSLMADTKLSPVYETDTISKIKPLLNESVSRCLPVINSQGKAIGIISESDITGEAKISAVMVDHNEVEQAIDGIDNYEIKAIIDHHRIKTLTTKQPIYFLNQTVGSTSTIITGLYRSKHVPIPKDIAPLLLCGILSDTLILQSGTTTDVDREAAEYLSTIANLDIQEIGKEIINAGSHIGERSPDDVIRQDMKIYTEGTIKFTASQIEVGSTDEVLSKKTEFLDELEITRRANGALFSVLLVTDITTLSSVMLIAADPKFLSAMSLTRMEDRIFYLKDVVSRKKQLIPLLYEQIGRYWA